MIGLLLALPALGGPLQLETGRPTRYDLSLVLDPASASFDGVVDIAVTLDKPTRQLQLHAVDLTVTTATADGLSAAVTADADTLTLSWDQALRGDVVLHLEYQGTVVQDGPYGMFHQSVDPHDYLFTQFEATDARRAFPCFDQPDFKTPFAVTLDVPEGDQAFANAPIADTRTVDGRRIVRFADTPPLPTYLISWAVGPFEVVDVGAGGRDATPIRMVVPTGFAEGSTWSGSHTAPVLAAMEDWFDSPYPYKKLDIVGIPETLGFTAMEHPGLVTFDVSLVSIHEADDTEARRRAYVDVLAHELAHQWFGNLVTPVWWDDIWLNESFASWMGTKVVEPLHPEWRFDVDRVASRSGVMASDSLASARQIREPIVTDDDIANAFDGITYRKGQAVLEMFEGWVGPTAFQQGVRSYLADHAHGNATAADFLASIDAATEPRGVDDAFSTFLDQPGVPVVGFDLQCGDEARLLLTQERYLAAGKPKGERWDLPVCVRYPGAEGPVRQCHRLQKKRATMKLQRCPEWWVPNDGAQGYYRARMAPEAVETLLGGDALTVVERVGLLSDAAALVEAGKLSPAVLLGQVPALLALEERAVTAETLAIVLALDDHLVRPELRPNYQRFIRQTYGPLASELGLDPREGEDAQTTLLRPRVVGLLGHQGADADVIAAASARATTWLDTGEGIAPEMLPVVLAIAVNHGDRQRFDRVLEAAHAETEPQRRRILFGAAAHTRDPEALGDVFALATSGDVSVREMASLVIGPLSRTDQLPIGWTYVQDHLERFEQVVPGIARAYLIMTGAGWCDAGHRAEVEALFAEPSRKWLGGKRTLAQTLEGIDVCIASRQRQQEAVDAFLTGVDP